METYEEFIQNILDTRGRFACGDEYHERHHIVPRCMGGEDEKENLIDLFAREHFIAHKLLASENPENVSLGHAYTMMAFARGVEISAEEYQEAKIHLSKIMSETRVGESNTFYGKNHTEETKQILSQKAAVRYATNGSAWKGRHHTDQTKQILSQGAIAMFQNPEYREKYSRGQKKRYERQEERDLVSDRNSITVLQLSLSGEIVEEYKNAIVAHNQTGISEYGIWSCCEFNQVTAGGYQWIYKRDYEIGKRPLTKRPEANKPVPIVQLTMLDEYIAEYESMTVPQKLFGYDRSGINKCCLFQQKSAYGFHWMTKENYEKILKQKGE